VWEILDEPAEVFLAEIRKRKKLDSFKAQTAFRNCRKIDLVFDEEHAQISLQAPPDGHEWFEHFLIDIRKNVHRPSFRQFWMSFMSGLVFPGSSGGLSVSPRSAIVIQGSSPNPLVENIKANLVSNAIWAILGALLLLFAQWVARRFGVDINPFG